MPPAVQTGAKRIRDLLSMWHTLQVWGSFMGTE